jgi:RNA polymerase sigma-70 factor (ECF subfamily)
MNGNISDQELVGSIINGRPENFKLLIDRYKNLVAHIICRLVSKNEEKDDLGQEIFIRIYRSLPRFGFRSNLATWISRIAYNHCLNYLRKENRPDRKIIEYDDCIQSDSNDEPEEGKEIVLNSVLPPDEILIKKEIFNYLDAEINNLPVKYRMVITLYYLEKRSHQEIAEIMETRVTSVKVYLFRARIKLKEALLLNYDMEDICL